MKERAIRLANLIMDNPTLEVITMVEHEIVFDDSNFRWRSQIGRSKIDEYWHNDERIWFKSLDIEELREYYGEVFWLDDEDISDEDLEIKVDKRLKDIPWEKAIIVNIDLP